MTEQGEQQPQINHSLQTFQEQIDQARNDHENPQANSSSWKEKFDGLDFDWSPFIDPLSKIITNEGVENADIIDFLTHNNELVLLTIASGLQGQGNIIHNIFQPVGEDFVGGLLGMGKQANAMKLLEQRLFKVDRASDTIKVPALEDVLSAFASFPHLTSLDNVDKSETIPFTNSLIIPPSCVKIINELENPNDIKEISTAITQFMLTTHTQRMEELEAARTEEDDQIQHETTGVIQQYLNLSNILSIWAEQNNKKEQGFQLSENEKLIETQIRMNSTLSSSTQPPPPPPPPGGPTPPGDGGLNFTGGPPGGSSTTPPAGAPPNFNENRNNPPFGNDPGTVAPDQAQAITTFMMNSASLMARAAESFERNNPEANKKVSSLLINQFRNLATPDGSIQAEGLTEDAKLLFRAPQSEGERLLNSWLREAKAKVIPSSTFVKAARTGDTVSSGKPDKFSTYFLYPKTQKSLVDQQAQSKRTQKLEMGIDLKDDEVTQLLSDDRLPARNFSQLSEKIKGMAAIHSKLLGKDSIITITLENASEWLEENEDKLYNKQILQDKDLALRCEYFLDTAINQMHDEALDGVPTLETIDIISTLKAILKGTATPMVPTFIMEELEKNKGGKRKGGEGNGNNNNNNINSNNRYDSNKKQIVENRQPDPSIQTTKKEFDLLYQFQKADVSDNKPPMFNSNCSECLNFHFKGFCTDPCWRSASHNKLSTARTNKLRDFKNKALKWGKDNKIKSNFD